MVLHDRFLAVIWEGSERYAQHPHLNSVPAAVFVSRKSELVREGGESDLSKLIA